MTNRSPRIRIDSIDTSKMGKIALKHSVLHELLGLPDDVMITSMHTTRGEPETAIYMICDRFNKVPTGGTAPEMKQEDLDSIGLWDGEGND